MDLSIVIPAFEEGHKLARDIMAAGQFLKDNALTGEILVVDDGSKDNTAQAACDVPVPVGVTRRVIRNEAHRGKGCGVRTGMTQTTGQYAMFADCGLCIPYDNVLAGLEILRSGACDIAHGSRRHLQSAILRGQPWHRRLISRSFKATVRTMLGVPRELTDTQCGFKVYRGDVARELYAQCVTDGFLFDIEIILRAVQQGYRISEFPVEWVCDRDSRLSVTRTPWPVLAELYALRRAMTRDHSPPIILNSAKDRGGGCESRSLPGPDASLAQHDSVISPPTTASSPGSHLSTAVIRSADSPVGHSARPIVPGPSGDRCGTPGPSPASSP